MILHDQFCLNHCHIHYSKLCLSRICILSQRPIHVLFSLFCIVLNPKFESNFLYYKVEDFSSVPLDSTYKIQS